MSENAVEKLLSPEESVDLTNCDREPIHIPGSIQPHGMLFALSQTELNIVQASSNTAALLGIAASDLLGRPIADLVGEENTTYLRSLLEGGERKGNPAYAFSAPVALGERTTVYEWVLHLAERDVPILEAELAPVSVRHTEVSDRIKRAIPSIRSAHNLTALYSVVATEVRRLTGFDRVMVYRFDADGHGSVVAEDRREDLPAYLGLHYPASDIPKQARRLYVLNALRLIADVNYTPSPVLPVLHPEANAPLDMSFCSLRSVSPIHVEYLKNMGVGASMSISLIQDGELWGLIACHHYSGPRYLSYEVRSACELLGQVVSLQLNAKEGSEDEGLRDHIRGVSARLVEFMAQESNYREGLYRFTPTGKDLVECSGCAIFPGIDENQPCIRLGDTPTEKQIERIVAYLAARGALSEVFATDRLSTLIPEADGYRALVSGVLAMPLPGGAPTACVLWFRPEVVQTVYWAGDPNKTAEPMPDGGERLSPRKSFEKWQQELTGRSLAWRRVEIDAVRDLRRAISTVIMSRAEELTRVNTELTISNAELDSFAYVASHDLREPLRGIYNYAQFLQEDHGEELTEDARSKVETIQRLTRRMENLIESLLHYSRVGRLDISLQEVDTNVILAETLESLATRLRENSVEVRIPRPLPSPIRCDPVQIGEVFSNLIANAIKYNDKSAGERWVEIGYIENTEEPVWFYVRDNGIGISEDHYETVFRIFKRLHGRNDYGGGTGAGLTITRKIVERHGGVIRIESAVGKGTTFYFTLSRN